MFMLFCNQITIAQVGIGNISPNGALDITSANNGLLVPQIALTARNDASTVITLTDSELIYNTATAGAGIEAVTPGYYYWNLATLRWVRLLNAPDSNWSLYGNSSTDPTLNWLGTNDDQDLQIRTNGRNRIRVKSSSVANPVVGIGTNFPNPNLVPGFSSGVLHIHDGGTTTFSQLILSSSSLVVGNRSGVLNFAATSAINERRTGSIESYLTADNGLLGASNKISGDLRLFTNNQNVLTERMRIDAAGNVGVNIVAPTSNMHVGGAIALPYNDVNAGTPFILTNAHYTVFVNNGVGSITLPDATTCLGRVYILLGANGIGNKTINFTGAQVLYDNVTNANITRVRANERFQIQSIGANGWILIGI